MGDLFGQDWHEKLVNMVICLMKLINKSVEKSEKILRKTVLWSTYLNPISKMDKFHLRHP